LDGYSTDEALTSGLGSGKKESDLYVAVEHPSIDVVRPQLPGFPDAADRGAA
jgi:hypothetical protein